MPEFKTAPTPALRNVSRFFSTLRSAPGAKVLQPGEMIDCLYFVERGSMEVRKNDQIVGVLGRLMFYCFTSLSFLFRYLQTVFFQNEVLRYSSKVLCRPSGLSTDLSNRHSFISLYGNFSFALNALDNCKCYYM